MTAATHTEAAPAEIFVRRRPSPYQIAWQNHWGKNLGLWCRALQAPRLPAGFAVYMTPGEARFFGNRYPGGGYRP